MKFIQYTYNIILQQIDKNWCYMYMLPVGKEGGGPSKDPGKQPQEALGLGLLDLWL